MDGFSMPSWDQIKWPLLIVGVIALVIVVIIVIVMLLRKQGKPLSPLELLVRNVAASALPIPAKGIYLSGNNHVPMVRIATAAKVVYTTHLVVLIIRPTSARVGWFKSLFRREILLLSPGDVQDLQGKTAIIRATGITQYVHNLFWIHPDMQDDTTRRRWARTLNLHEDVSASELLSEVQQFFLDGVNSLLSVQEALVAEDINARSRRAIPLLSDPGVMSDYHVHHREADEPRASGERSGQEADDELGAPSQGGT